MVQWGSPEAQDLDILMPGMVQTCSNPINNGIIIMLGGAGFCPSTVLCEYLEQDESQIERFTHTNLL